MSVRETILSYIEENHGVRPEGETRVLEEGIMDSASFIIFILFLEEEFELDIGADDLTEENFADLDTMVAYVERQAMEEDRATG